MTRFVRHFATALALLLAAVGAFTILIDPYDYWGTPRIAGLNAVKPAFGTQLIAAKAAQYARVRPKTIVAGNSRVEVGFDPRSPVWPRDMGIVYNYGLPGIGFAQMERQLERAVAVHRPTTLIVGLDLLDFRVDQAEWHAYAAIPPAPPTFAERARKLAEIALSLTALEDAAATLWEQHTRHPRDTTALGWEAPGGYARLVASDGEAALFAQRNRENARNYALGPKAVRWPGPGGSAQWAALDRLVRLCHARGIRLVLFTYPYHADILASLAHEGLLPALVDFNRAIGELAATNDALFWQFTTVNSIVQEPVPSPVDHASTRWYWEAGHFKAALGDRMIFVLTAPGWAQGFHVPFPRSGSFVLIDCDLAGPPNPSAIRALAADPARARRLAPAFAYADRP